MKGKRLYFLLAFSLLINCIFVPSVVNATDSEHVSKNRLILINTSTNDLFFLNGSVVKHFKVATGSYKTPTPVGSFRIVNKFKNRPYYKLNIPGGSPNNPLGNRWLGLDVGGTNGTTYAIHGNNNESQIGKSVSHGCIRMHNQDIQWLYDHVEEDMNVVINRSTSKIKLLAKENGYQLDTEKHHSIKAIPTPLPNLEMYTGHLIVINKYTHSIAYFNESRLSHIDYGLEANQIPDGRYITHLKNHREYELTGFVHSNLEIYHSTVGSINTPLLNGNYEGSPVIVVNRNDPYKLITKNYHYNMLIF
ncbi:L,D-transpeptidase [Fictibacillus sp. 23RED33]|uniref:L,D-transpeptidase n=1 Tax=Fictibacillus sp. 23RED33 TaxID=2745879 RepID=UPI0018CC9C32|nr:L,D-transpeptidase [Fictibacillus sp. 23RED33]MBH0175733.1 L,D-transpeptidase [Fictibacillus sp. 23RED33]